MALDLYHWEPTINSGEVLICLKEKGVDFVSHYVDVLAFEQHSPEFLALNPRGEVPVLVHDGHVLTEATLILEYLDATFAGIQLVPDSPTDRYRMRVWTKLADDYFAPALTLLGWHHCMAPKTTRRDRDAIDARLAVLPQDRQVVWRVALDDAYTAEQLTRARQHLDVVAQRLEETLGSSDWLAGARYSLADIAIFPAARAMQALRELISASESSPNLAAWLKRMGERPAVRAALGLSRSTRPEEMFAPGPELGRWG
jgi:GSH-dependent disulfide-bond oxidoreductase